MELYEAELSDARRIVSPSRAATPHVFGAPGACNMRTGVYIDVRISTQSSTLRKSAAGNHDESEPCW